ncbi:hypothetical protein Taro_019733 [Colocasia esculenta]|uniref:Uncharacterized protein n=1 Tax=Colocasia esculenta TaxID=4460 RepID=A0A843UXM2_COLES|nr:hypothetical protein [Colocasia esculenta]
MFVPCSARRRCFYLREGPNGCVLRVEVGTPDSFALSMIPSPSRPCDIPYVAFLKATWPMSPSQSRHLTGKATPPSVAFLKATGSMPPSQPRELSWLVWDAEDSLEFYPAQAIQSFFSLPRSLRPRNRESSQQRQGARRAEETGRRSGSPLSVGGDRENRVLGVGQGSGSRVVTEVSYEDSSLLAYVVLTVGATVLHLVEFWVVVATTGKSQCDLVVPLHLLFTPTGVVTEGHVATVIPVAPAFDVASLLTCQVVAASRWDAFWSGLGSRRDKVCIATSHPIAFWGPEAKSLGRLSLSLLWLFLLSLLLFEGQSFPLSGGWSLVESAARVELGSGVVERGGAAVAS